MKLKKKVNRKRAILPVGLTPAERATVERAAASYGMGLAEWIRQAISAHYLLAVERGQIKHE